MSEAQADPGAYDYEEVRLMSVEMRLGWVGELVDLIEWMDADLDGQVADTYQGQPLAQDWARVAKITEEAGEAVDALIGITGQNPRKGRYGSEDDLMIELADVALTALYAMQHFEKDADEVVGIFIRRARHHRSRRQAQLGGGPDGADHG